MTIPYEVSSRPWFGPRKRARQFLAARNELLSPAATVEQIATLLGPDAKGVQFLRFIDYVNRDENFHYTIVLTFTLSDHWLRENIFAMAADIVTASGWYPLVAGSRMASVKRLVGLARLVRRADCLDLDVGTKLLRVEPAVPPEEGCAIRVITDKASVLLDTGFPGLSPKASDTLALLTHHHEDHAGSALTPIFSNIPIVTSLGSAAMVALSRGLDRMPPNFYSWGPGRSLQIGAGISLSIFPVPHTPGSHGFALTDSATSIIYTGDVCVRTERHDFTRELMALAQGQSERRVFLLLDATMANRDAGASLSSAATNLILSAGDAPDVVLLARTPDHLLYAYLDLFSQLRRGGRESTEFLCDGSMRDLFQLIHAGFIERTFDNLDPFLGAQYEKAMHAWAETRWLYWIDQIPGQWPTHRRRIWFVTNRSSSEAVQLRPGAVFATIGRFGEADTPASIADQCARLDTDTTPWTLHSNSETLVTTVSSLSEYADVVLFHNFVGRLRKFVRKNGLRADVLGEPGLALG